LEKEFKMETTEKTYWVNGICLHCHQAGNAAGPVATQYPQLSSKLVTLNRPHPQVMQQWHDE
jgi:hypothetical protein